MTVIGIIGEAECDEAIVVAHLADAQGTMDELTTIVGIPDNVPGVYGDILSWLIDNGITLDIFAGKEVELDVSFTNAANKSTTVANVADKVVSALIKSGDAKLYVLVGPDAEAMSDELNAAIQKAADNGIECYDLSEGGLDLLLFGEEEEEAESDGPDLDLEQAGAAADEGDIVAIGLLTEEAEKLGLDPDEYPTWVELAETIYEKAMEALDNGQESEPEADAAPEPEDDTAEWTADNLPTDLKELRAIAKASGIDGFAKMTRTDLVAALTGAPEEAPEEPVAAEKPSKPSLSPKTTPTAPEATQAPQFSPDLTSALTLVADIYRLLQKHFS